MTKYREILRLKSQGMSNRGIATSCQCSRNTVADVLKKSVELSVEWPLPEELSDIDLKQILFPEKGSSVAIRQSPDCEWIHKELAKNGVTLSLLWSEYCLNSRSSGQIPFSYSQFSRYYRKFAQATKATMRISRKPGEMMEVDWAGTSLSLINDFDWSKNPVYFFVAVLPCSQYAYVEAFSNMTSESWITAHKNAFKHFGGIPRILIPDNLKTGVEKSSKYNPVINKIYQEMAEHYSTVVLPARVRKPKDKASVEGTVGNITTWIIAALRNQQFFTLIELNKEVQVKLKEFNERPFQKKEGSRFTAFLEEEQNFLMPLPAAPYELATWMKATVQYDYHITADRMHYSVPHEYIKCEVHFRLSKDAIEVFFEDHRIASHKRLTGMPGQRVTLPEHMPDNHKKYLQWDFERFMEWAQNIGPNTSITMHAILSAHKIKQQGYRASMGIVKLADKYSVGRLEQACKRALSYTPSPSLKSIQTILKTGQDKFDPNDECLSELPKTSEFSYTRGADYYGGKKHD